MAVNQISKNFNIFLCYKNQKTIQFICETEFNDLHNNDLLWETYTLSLNRYDEK